MRMKKENNATFMLVNYVQLECKTIIYVICYYLLYYSFSNNAVLQ